MLTLVCLTLSITLALILILRPVHLNARKTTFRSPHDPVNHFFSFFTLLLWFKLRAIYYANNWIYTTNHKRIAVNYYWFVIFSGICGMVLATIIRLEMAYPGVGILAGDSLQYLSVVTAHAVIMVFFMIMPLLFGAFGNFLLPTQLGVHDVAFPRLNSAAFWFLPAGLLMLVQLVCLDRRYQRMNCYNIREIQTILKSKYTPNTSDTADVRFSLNDTTIGLRYQLNNLDFLSNSVLTLYKNNLTTNSPYSALHEFMFTPLVEFKVVKGFLSSTSLLYLSLSDSDLWFDIELDWYDRLKNTNPKLEFSVSNLFNFTLWKLNLSALLKDLCTGDVYLGQLTFETPSEHTSRLSWQKTFENLLGIDIDYLIMGLTTASAAQYSAHSYYVSLNPTFDASATLTKSRLQEKTSDFRALRMFNPVFKYDFKVGNYLPDDSKKMNKHLFATIKDLTTGVRKSSWFNSEDFLTLLRSSVASHFLSFYDNQTINLLRTSQYPNKKALISLNSDLDTTFAANQYHSTNANPTSAFYNFFFSLDRRTTLSSDQHEVLEKIVPLNGEIRWVAANAMTQKFYKMFATTSMQQRIYSNWRQLKFTREAWRCKLLAARHQNTLYRRYLNEDSVVWAVERNAKDVLPGWAMITPFSARTRFTAIGKVDIGLMGVFLVLNSSIVSSANFLVTYRYLSTLNNRKMRDARSFFTEGVMVASWMMIAANPMLAIGILMLLSDRHWQTSFFDYSGGGDTVLFQHMFWFFGHPEVYVIMIPGFGFNNTILSFYLRKRVSARASLLYSMYTIAFLGFFVWGHHMYMVGLAHTTRMLFSTLTVMISVPAATKLMHWCVTLVNSSFAMELPMFFQLLFIFFFVSGGISGMAVAHTGMDVLFHDSFYVVGHFHVMLAGSAMFAAFGAFYFYFPAIFGVKYSRIYGYLHCLYYLIGQLMTVVPMFWLGYASMPRRVLDYPAALGGWHAIVSAGHMLSVAGMTAFFIMIFDSMRQGRAATRNAFGVPRFNTRLNFYIYEGARTWFIQRKGWHVARFNRHDSVRLNKLNHYNHEYLETTLYSYVLVKITH